MTTPLPPRKPRRLSPDIRRDALLDAAYAQFNRHGYTDARMDEVAKSAGVSKGTIYLYFPTKEALFEALLRRDVVPRLERILFILRHYNAPLSWLLYRVAGFAGGKIDSDTLPVYPKLLVREAARFPELARFYHEEVIGVVLDALSGLFGRAMARGEIRQGDPAMAAHLFLAPFVKAMLWHFTFGPVAASPFPARAYLRAHVDTFLRGQKP
ncbi:TetR/AcrR family transcriptional regulator [Asticcacaulis sp. BYS171W]|uniref:TetR/AcrR family transcriptional regulator n=1 Tax=Asticcacaulis aquaticus TaxID=2984212 RepID=A0ABT5HUS0_9CAUL|nr:TetR/AcrR family transcriptional regulator [Asticcacaulis aquaticus]MDC7683724.1 TetR/AcrR family transcriptional regulator [Asticcacaulis aquaticus]